MLPPEKGNAKSLFALFTVAFRDRRLCGYDHSRT